MGIVGPRVVGSANDDFLDIDETCGLQHLAGGMVIRNGAGGPRGRICQIPVPVGEMVGFGESMIIAAGF